ncbi:ATP-binding protein [Micromonospora rubida]|uniref:AAA family ATPase n=1 Tax=Micromonospora rubida TaxID=2697657 RepID=UPI00191C317C|nr:AAA family ATPase [Micromonospora rubida]
MGKRVPVVFFLVGFTGSGQTTYAKRVLEPAGAVRLSVDEDVFARHGRHGVDYPEYEYFERESTGRGRGAGSAGGVGVRGA